MNKKQRFYKIMTSLTLSGFLIIFWLTPILAGDVPSITVTPSVVEYKSGVSVLISGSGLAPKQKLKLFVFSMGGLPSGIHYMVKPQPLPNDFGAFASIWKPGREISRKLLEPLPMVYTLSVEDDKGKTLCTTPLLFCDPKGKDKFPCELSK